MAKASGKSLWKGEWDTERIILLSLLLLGVFSVLILINLVAVNDRLNSITGLAGGRAVRFSDNPPCNTAEWILDTILNKAMHCELGGSLPPPPQEGGPSKCSSAWECRIDDCSGRAVGAQCGVFGFGKCTAVNFLGCNIDPASDTAACACF